MGFIQFQLKPGMELGKQTATWQSLRGVVFHLAWKSKVPLHRKQNLMQETPGLQKPVS